METLAKDFRKIGEMKTQVFVFCKCVGDFSERWEAEKGLLKIDFAYGLLRKKVDDLY